MPKVAQSIQRNANAKTKTKKPRSSLGCCGPSTLSTPLRFDPRSSEEMTHEQLQFANAMRAKLDGKPFVPDVALAVAIGLGYRPPARLAHELSTAMNRFATARKNKIKFLAFSEVLGVMLEDCGWQAPADVAPAPAGKASA